MENETILTLISILGKLLPSTVYCCFFWIIGFKDILSETCIANVPLIHQ